jgi:hypothetical protein
LILLSHARHLDSDIVEALASDRPLDGVLATAERMVVTVTEPEPFSVCLRGLAEICELVSAMHGKRRIVGPDDGLIRIYDDHPFSHSSYDLLQLAAITTRAAWVHLQAPRLTLLVRDEASSPPEFLAKALFLLLVLVLSRQ